MKHCYINYVVLVTACCLIAACNDKASVDAQIDQLAIQVVDFSGRSISLSEPASKIVALAPHIVENVFSAGAGDALVGVMQYSDYPEAATQIPIVGGYEKTNFEKIIELNPDLIIAWQSGNSHSAIQRLVELGYTVYVDQADSLQDVARSIRDIGVLTAHSEKAEAVAAAYLRQLKQVQERYKNAPKVKTFYQVWNSPLQTISGNHIISEAIEICGGSNIYVDEFAVAPIINIESVLQRDPEVIIASGISSARPEWLDQWLQWDSIAAVKQDNLFFVNGDHIQRHTLRLLMGINAICEKLELARERSKK
ncbi:MAG: iron complex transport system substrate-binding protein [Arenicella sp.]|jgi:iron complex transport system substrate-binding protein